jgi:Na+/melibiose symporter-like transporter
MRESGYFLPHVPIGYGATVLAALAVWPLMRYVFGIRSDALILISMVVVGILFGVWFLRYAKMLWLVLDLTLHPPSREDFQSRGRRQ